jgi:hypothetical protein
VDADGGRELLHNHSGEGDMKRYLNRKERDMRSALTREGSRRCRDPTAGKPRSTCFSRRFGEEGVHWQHEGVSTHQMSGLTGTERR